MSERCSCILVADVYDLLLPTTLFSVAANVFRNVFLTSVMCFEMFCFSTSVFIYYKFSHVLNSRNEFVDDLPLPPKRVPLGVGFFTIFSRPGNYFKEAQQQSFTRVSCRYCGSGSHWWREYPVRIGRFQPGSANFSR